MILKYLFVRMRRDYLGHILLTLFPILLITVFSFIYKDAAENLSEVKAFLTIGFVLMFHYFASTYTTEFVHKDIATPMKDRLLASPTNTSSFPLQTIFMGSCIVYLQSLVVLLYAYLILGAGIERFWVLLPVFYFSVLLVQLIAGMVVLLSRNLSLGSGAMIGMGVLFPFLAQFNATLPDHAILNFFRDYGTPMSLSFRAINGIMYGRADDVVVSLLIQVLLIIMLVVSVRLLTRKVIR